MNIVDELYSRIEDGRNGKNQGLKTGLPKLDFYTGGLKKGVYKLIFSKSSIGEYLLFKENNFAVLESDFRNNDRAISEKAKLYVKENYPSFVFKHVNSEIMN